MRSQLVAFAACAIVLTSTQAVAAEGATSPEAICESTLALLREGKSREAVAVSLGQSELFAGKVADTEAMVAAIDTAIRVYGPVRSQEKLSEVAIGTTFVRRLYLVQHDRMVTRWEFDVARLPTGWSVVYMGFDDQVRNWQQPD